MLNEHEAVTMIKSCEVCGLCKQANGPVSPEGKFASDVFVLSDSPNKTENMQGRIYTGGPGKEWENYLRNVGMQKHRIYQTNVVKCRSAKDRYTDAEITFCFQLWGEQELYNFQGKYIVTQGSAASQQILGKQFDLFKSHGIPQRVNYTFAHGESREFIVFPMFHPSFGIHSTGKMVYIQEDMAKLKQVLLGNYLPEDHKDLYPNPDYREPSNEELVDLLMGEEISFIFVDTETLNDMRTPWSLQFSTQPGTGYFIRADNEFGISIAKAVMEKEGVTTVLHNAKFDLKVLRKMGIVPFRFEDSMVYAYNLQNQPQGLKNLAWRLCAMEMVPFTEMVRPATTAKFLRYFQEVISREWPESDPILEYVEAPEFRWNHIEERIPCTKRHKEKIDCECKKNKSGLPLGDCRVCEGKGYYRIKTKRGSKVQIQGTEHGHYRLKTPQNIRTKVERILNAWDKDPSVNVVDRWYNFDPSERQMVEAVLGPLRVCDLTEIDYADAIKYACRDADATCRVYWHLAGETTELGLDRVIAVDQQIVQMSLEMEDFGMPAREDKFIELSTYYEEEMAKLQELVDFVAGYKVNIASPKQVQDLLFNKFGIKPEKFTDYEEENPSTDSEALMFIENKHPLVPQILAWRGFQKNKTSFADKLPKMIEGDGRIRGNIKITRTITGRLAMDEPNLMNIPTRSKEGQKVRECFEAPEGYLFVTGDYGQIEMRVACHDARDPIMTDIFIQHHLSGGAPEWDIHRQTAARIFGIPVSEVEEDAHRTPAKSAGFGILNQITGQGLADFMVKVGCHGWSADRCDELIKEWFGIYKSINEYFERQKTHARRYGYVKDMFGKVYRMPEYKSVLKGVRSQGERNTCNYFVQGGAQGIMKRGMLALRKEVLGLREAGFDIQYLLQIHDDQLDLCPEEHVSWYVPMKKGIFENAVKLTIPLVSDCKIGKSWGNLTKVKS